LARCIKKYGQYAEIVKNIYELKIVVLPSKGTASEVAGIVSATMFKNTVKLSNIVTPVKTGDSIRFIGFLVFMIWDSPEF